MPELPEVETIRAGLERHVVGRAIASAVVRNQRAVRRDAAGPGGFAAAMTGRTLTTAERRGKYLWFALGADEALLAHLGMSGQLLVGEPGRPVSEHVRARFTFTDGGPDLRFTDQRTFGHLMMAALADGVPVPIAHIAPDPLEPAFDPEAFAARLARKRTGIKRALLDQSLISGIGNIYADEALWRARLHWARPAGALRRAQVSRLLEAVNDVLTEALKVGGTSFDALYVNVNGESGYFDRSLNVYGRQGAPCQRCATPIRRDAFMNRSAYSCPRCQRLRRPGKPGDLPPRWAGFAWPTVVSAFLHALMSIFCLVCPRMSGRQPCKEGAGRAPLRVCPAVQGGGCLQGAASALVPDAGALSRVPFVRRTHL